MNDTAIFMSKSKNLLVAFEEIRKETRDGVHPFKMERFEEHRLEIDPKKDYGIKRGKGSQIIKRLQNHPHNKLNGGAEFWQLDQNDLEAMEFAEGKVIARTPEGGIDKDLKKQLNDLYKSVKDYKDDMHQLLVEETQNLFDVFRIMGLPKPQNDHSKARFQAKLTEFFEVLQEREIFTPSEK